MQYKAAIFDLDGTLVDSLEDIADSVNETLSAHGFPVHPLRSYLHFVGNGSRTLIQRALPQDKASEALVDEILAEYKERYGQNILHKTRPYDGIMDMLGALRRQGIPMGICTNKHQSAAADIVGGLFPEGMFREVIGDQPGLPRKPDPSKALRMAKHFGAAPEEIAYFGDSNVDMETATRAGFLPIGVLWGFRSKEELIEGGAKVILSHPMEIFDKIVFSDDL